MRTHFVTPIVCLLSPIVSLVAADVHVSNDEQLRTSLTKAVPGTTILIQPGKYRGNIYTREIRGTTDRPIIVKAADPQNPPIIEGGAEGMHFSQVEYLTLDGLILEKAQANGLNIDHGGDITRPSHHIVLKNLTVRHTGSSGNHDAIKLSGVSDFEVSDCRIELWGRSGSGVDMVGCHRGEIRGCDLIGREEDSGNGIQTKGGSEEVHIRACRFEHVGNRGVNIGGSTGLAFFSPEDATYEARNIVVEDCVFIGSPAPIAFVGVDGATVRHNTIHSPSKYVVRILQEQVGERFVPCRNGVFEKNLVVVDFRRMTNSTNVGPHTEPSSFVFRQNSWMDLSESGRRIRHEAREENGTYDKQATFVNSEMGDLRQTADSETKDVGSRNERALKPRSTFEGRR